MSSCAAGAALRLRLLKSTCATGVGSGATVSVDLCHQSGLEYLSHGFQTQGTVAAGASLKVRLESICVPGPWISDPRYGCHRSGLEGCDHSRLVYLSQGFQTQGTEYEDHVLLETIVARTRGPLTTRFHRSLHMQYAARVGEDATEVDFKLPHRADFRSCLLGITPS
jgi:hypothetical protein